MATLSNTDLRNRIIQASKESLPLALTRPEVTDLAAWAAGQSASTDFVNAETARSTKRSSYQDELNEANRKTVHVDLYSRLATLRATKEGSLPTRLTRFEVHSLASVV